MHKVAVIGNTKLTLLALEECLVPEMEVISLFSLDKESTAKKTNGVDLQPFCKKNNIHYLDNNNWDEFNSVCIRGGVRTVFVLGDSRILPKKFLNNHPVIIGNHGAILPDVKGGASLVWGRMINSGFWGVSLFKIEHGIDTGPILARESFAYEDVSMEEFVSIADKLTVKLLKNICSKIKNDETLEEIENEHWSIKIAKHTDSQEVCRIASHCLKNEITIYLPPRTPKDSYLKQEWNLDFKEQFKKANNLPYPIWKSDD